VPILVNGKPITVLRLLSTAENRFTEALISDIAFGAYLVGFALMYKRENSRNLGLANYFNSAFNSVIPQLMVSSDGAIVKTNGAAAKTLASTKDALRDAGMDFTRASWKSCNGNQPSVPG